MPDCHRRLRPRVCRWCPAATRRRSSDSEGESGLESGLRGRVPNIDWRGATVYDVLVDNPLSSAHLPGHTVWLSGAILTFLNKVVFPTLWLTVLAWVLIWAFVTYGRISIAGGFGFIVLFVVISTVVMMWMTVHLQRVGYRGRELLIATYWREAWVPFDQVAAGEPVWWYRSRLVRIRFHRTTPFGTCVYYLPKWGPLRGLFTKPEEKLRRVLWPGFQ